MVGSLFLLWTLDIDAKSIAAEDGYELDGIWACASLLHVPGAELPDVMQRLCKALKPGGVLYASFKYGTGEREHHGRRFTDLDEPGLAALLRHVAGTSKRWRPGPPATCAPAARRSAG